jgi:hypothetical protein
MTTVLLIKLNIELTIIRRHLSTAIGACIEFSLLLKTNQDKMKKAELSTPLKCKKRGRGSLAASLHVTAS